MRKIVDAKINIEKRKKALEHISYSRMRLWKSSIKQFEKRYFKGEKTKIKYMQYGKHINGVCNYEEKPASKAERALRKKFDAIFDGQPEVEVRANFSHNGVQYPLIGYIDREYKDCDLERKCGKTKRVMKDVKEQLMFYDTIRNVSGCKPKLCGIGQYIPIVEYDDGSLDVKMEGDDVGVVEYEYEWTLGDIKKTEIKIRQFINGVMIQYPMF